MHYERSTVKIQPMKVFKPQELQKGPPPVTKDLNLKQT